MTIEKQMRGRLWYAEMAGEKKGNAFYCYADLDHVWWSGPVLPGPPTGGTEQGSSALFRVTV